MKPSDTLASVSQRAGIAEQQLREANRIPPRYRLAPGSTILVPRDETTEDIAATSLDARFALVPEASNLRKVTYRVRRGDTLLSVARRHKVSEKDIIVWNQLTGPTLFAGQRLELTVPAAASSTAKRGKSGPSANTAAAKSGKATPKAAVKSPAPAAGKVATNAR